MKLELVRNELDAVKLHVKCQQQSMPPSGGHGRPVTTPLTSWKMQKIANCAMKM